MKALALVPLLVPALAAAQPAVRYNEPPTLVPRAPLAARIDELVARVARSERRPEPRPDARLDAAATEIVRAAADGDTPPNELVQGALWAHGIVEPSPQLTLTAMDPGGEEGLLRAIAEGLPEVLRKGRFSRVGVGIAPVGAETRVIVALQESFVDLEPIARAQPLGGNVLLRGRLRDGFVRPEAFVTTPDGTVLNRVLVGGDPVRFGGTFRCGPKKGRYQVEVTGEDRFGTTVLANFPVWCGVTAPATAVAAAPAHAVHDTPFTSAAASEHEMWKLLNADRAHAGLPPLEWDASLAAVARGHSADMQAHGFFGHTSPTTGSAMDRAQRAHVDAMLIEENVARAISAGEAERGLMNSPGHRANILSHDVTHVGVGVVYDPASREIFVTQMFSRPSQKFDSHTIEDLRRALAAVRHGRGRRPLEHDAMLDELAGSTVREIVAHGMTTSVATHRIAEAVSRDGRWSSVSTSIAVAPTVAQAVDSLGKALGDPTLTHAGVGVQPFITKQGDHALYIVAIFATLASAR